MIQPDSNDLNDLADLFFSQSRARQWQVGYRSSVDAVPHGEDPHRAVITDYLLREQPVGDSGLDDFAVVAACPLAIAYNQGDRRCVHAPWFAIAPGQLQSTAVRYKS